MNILHKHSLNATFADYISDAIADLFGEKNDFNDAMAGVLNKLTFDYDNVNDIYFDERAKIIKLIYDELMGSLPSTIQSLQKIKVGSAIHEGVRIAVQHLKDEQNKKVKKTFVTVLATTKRNKHVPSSVFHDDESRERPKVHQLLCTSTEDKIEKDWINSGVLALCAERNLNTIYIWRLEDFEEEMVVSPDDGIDAGFNMYDIIGYHRTWRTYYVEDLGVEEEHWYEGWKKNVDELLKNKFFVK